MSSLEELKKYQHMYNIMHDRLTHDLHKELILGKSRRQGYSNVDKLWSEMRDPLYNIRTNCKNLLKELHRYSMTGHKIPFTKEEENNIVKMLESKDEYTLQLCKQIILTKLNE